LSNTLSFLKRQRYENVSTFAPVTPAIEHLVETSKHINIILISDGSTGIRGTPFDARIDQAYGLWRAEQQKSQMPFVTILCGSDGKWTAFSVTALPWPIDWPKASKESAITASPAPTQPAAGSTHPSQELRSAAPAVAAPSIQAAPSQAV